MDVEANETIHFRKCEPWDGAPDKKIHFLLQTEAIQLFFVKRWKWTGQLQTLVWGIL